MKINSNKKAPIAINFILTGKILLELQLLLDCLEEFGLSPIALDPRRSQPVELAGNTAISEKEIVFL